MKTVTTTREYDDELHLVEETVTVDDHVHPPVTTHEARYGGTFSRPAVDAAVEEPR